MSDPNQVTIDITGMSCGHCVARVQRALQTVPGIADVEVQVGSARLTVSDGARERVTAEARRAIENAGYEAA